MITFDLASLDTLDALGIEIDGLPGTNLPEYLSRYGGENYAKVGSLFEPDYEAVAALAPDLIIVAGRSSAAYGELSKIAPTIDLSNDWADFANSIKANSRILGEIFDKTAEVDAMIADLDARIAATQAAAAGAGTGLVVLTSAGEVTAYGPGSRFGWIHETAGVTPAVADVGRRRMATPSPSRTSSEADPDWLFVIDRDAATGAEARARRSSTTSSWRRPAWQNDHVIYVDPSAPTS